MEPQHIKAFSIQNLRRINGNQGHSKAKIAREENSPEIYELAQINLFIGKNGAGKSTILDMVNCVREPGYLGTIPRENMTHIMHSYFWIRGELFGIKVDFPSIASPIKKYKYDCSEYQHVYINAFSINGNYECEGHFNKYAYEQPTCDIDFLKLLPIKIWHSNEATEIRELQVRHFEELNKIAHLLKGTMGADKEEAYETLLRRGETDKDARQELQRLQQKPIVNFGDRTAIGYFAGDDTNQWQNVPIARMPSGWLAYIRIIGWLREEEIVPGSVCLIEEPEVHLHPSLQRALMDRIKEIARKKNLQLLIASHSPLFINMAATLPNAKLFGVNSINRLEEIIVPEVLLKDLDVKGSDILQTNGVIWVEGESEKIYLKHWISKVLEERGITVQLDYEICEYGGANLGHFGCAGESEFTQINKMNRNLIVLFDRDNDFSISHTGQPILINETCYKARIWRELANTSNSAIVTDTYSIEGYLPKDFFDAYFKYDDEGKMKLLTTYSKVEIAKKFRKLDLDIGNHQFNKNLLNKINQIVDKLVDWNT